MESLLRLSGLLSEEDGGRTDLGTLEKRLADRQQKIGSTSSRRSTTSTSAVNRSSSESVRNSPPQDRATTPPGSTVTSPGSREDPEEEVEALSDMMCSLVTNNCGESRFIGTDAPHTSPSFLALTMLRFIIGILYIFAERHTVGKRKDRGLVLPGNDIFDILT
jgi:hypothetical protein